MKVTPPEPLGANHDLSRFDCGKPALNSWLTAHATFNEAKGFTRVIVVADGRRVAAFYGVAPTAVAPPTMPRALRTGRPPDPVPCVLLGQFAVDLEYQGRGLGSALLRDALARCVAGAATIGGRAVVVRAIDPSAAAYWRSWGFLESRSDPSVLFRSVDDIGRWLDAR